MEERARVGRIGGDVDRVDAEAARVATAVTRTGFGLLEDELYETIMRADRGIVDVYWLRKTEVADEKLRLATERAERLRELDARFGLINQKLEVGDGVSLRCRDVLLVALHPVVALAQDDAVAVPRRRRVNHGPVNRGSQARDLESFQGVLVDSAPA